MFDFVPKYMILATYPRPPSAFILSPHARAIHSPMVEGGEDKAETDIIAFVAENVAPYKKLRGGVVFTDVIPKSASGKILRWVVVVVGNDWGGGGGGGG